MLPKHLAKSLLSKWGAHERRELSKTNYPPVSPMFKGYISGYRSNHDVADDDGAADKVGAALSLMHPGLKSTLKAVYLDGGKIPRKAHAMAIYEFCRIYPSVE